MKLFLIVMLLLLAACTPDTVYDGSGADSDSTEQGAGQDNTENDNPGMEKTTDTTTSHDDTGTGRSDTTESDGSTAGPDTFEGDDTSIGEESDGPDTEKDPVDTGPSITCPEGSDKYVSAGGKTYCCPAEFPVFCDEQEGGYAGGCWSSGVDCGAITHCGDKWSACKDGALPYCDDEDGLVCITCTNPARKYETASGRPVCCTDDRPLFCDENDAGYEGGCWTVIIDCSTIIPCNESWGACVEGMVASCKDGLISCMPEG